MTPAERAEARARLEDVLARENRYYGGHILAGLLKEALDALGALEPLRVAAEAVRAARVELEAMREAYVASLGGKSEKAAKKAGKASLAAWSRLDGEKEALMCLVDPDHVTPIF